MIVDVYDITILSYLQSKEYKKFTDFVKRKEFNNMPSKDVIRFRLIYLYNNGYIELNNSRTKGRLTEEGNQFFYNQLNFYTTLQDCFKAKWYKNKWSKTCKVYYAYKSIYGENLSELENLGLVKKLGDAQFSPQFASFITTHTGDIFTFSNIIHIRNPLSKLWKLKNIRGNFDFTKPKGKSWQDIFSNKNHTNFVN